MRAAALFVSVLALAAPIFVSAAPRQGIAVRVDPSSCSLSGIATDGNDIRLDRDKRPAGHAITLPKAVVEKVLAAAAEMLSEVPPEFSEGLTCDELLFYPVYRVSGFAWGQLFVAEADTPAGGGYFFLILYNPKTGAVTRDPIRIGAKWPQAFGARDPLLKFPLVSSSDLFHDGHQQIVFEERVHNGTVYNGVIYHYFYVGPDLRLIRILALETRVIAPLREQSIYSREVTPLGSHRLRMDIYETRLDNPGDRRPLGYAILDRANEGVPFHVAERHPQPGFDERELVTFAELEEPSGGDDAFLRNGYTFYY